MKLSSQAVSYLRRSCKMVNLKTMCSNSSFLVTANPTMPNMVNQFV